jgi:hypothetical protein
MVSRCGCPRSILGQTIWDMWWTKWNWGKFSPITSASPANSHSSDCSTVIIIIISIIIIIHYPGLVQYSKQ